MHANLWESLLNSISIPVLAVDDFGHILQMNDAARRLLPSDPMTNLPPDNSKITGKGLVTLFPEWYEILDIFKTHQDGFKREIRLDSGKIVDVSVRPILHYGWAITVYDISMYKDAENAHSNLLGEVTHDLKQPLAAISGFADVIEANGEMSPKQHQYLSRIRNTVGRMSELIYQLIDVAWIESGMKLTISEVDISGLTRSAVDELTAYATARQINLTFETDSDIPALMADYNRLSQSVTNLITNGIKYSKAGGTVAVKVWNEPAKVVLSVTDQGIGIAPEHLPNLFQRFYRVQSKETRLIEGSGLGLYISRTIIEQHGGRITVDSELGKGSQFTIYLPAKHYPSRYNVGQAYQSKNDG